MQWGALQLSEGMGPAARVLLDEHGRRCRELGVGVDSVGSLVPSELGFEHNLGLLHSAYRTRGSRAVRQGVIEHEYYLERCLLESEGALFPERGVSMCASIVGDCMVQQMYHRVFSRDAVAEVLPQVQIPELRIHPASEVGIESRVALKSGVDGQAGFPPGHCYLALMRSEWVQEAARELGPEPKLIDLVKFGEAGAFLPDVQLAQLSIKEASGSYHVGEGPGHSFAGLLDRVRDQPSSLEWLLDGFDYRGEYGVGADAHEILCEWLSLAVGRKVVLSEHTLSLVTNSAALLDSEARKKLRSLESVGDAVLSLMIARDNYFRAEPVERYQNLRSHVTSNKVLSEKFVQYVPKGAVRFVGNVNPSAGVTGAKALESIFGAVWLELGDYALSVILRYMGFMDFNLQVDESPPMRLLGTVGLPEQGSFG